MLTLADTCTMVLEMKIFKNRSMYFHFGFGISQYFVRAKIIKICPVALEKKLKMWKEIDSRTDGQTTDKS